MQTPAAMDRHLDVLSFHENGGLLLGASSLTGRYWLGSLWFYSSPDLAPDVEHCTAGVQLEAGLHDATWVDNQHVLLALDTGGVTLWELQDDNKTFAMVQSSCEHDLITSSVSVNGDASFFVSASYDRCIKVWSRDLVSSHTYKAHSDIVWDVECHPTDPQLFLSCSQDGRTALWDTRQTKPAIVIEKTSQGLLPTCLSWQPFATKMFVTGYEDGHIVLRDLRAVVEKTVSNKLHKRVITRLAFSPDRPNCLASVSEDCKAMVMSANNTSITCLYESDVHCDFIYGVAWYNKDTLLTSSWDGQVVRHNLGNELTDNLSLVCNGNLESLQNFKQPKEEITSNTL